MVTNAATTLGWEQEQPLTEAETYEALLRSLKRKWGFNLLFVRCTPVQGDRVIRSLRQDLPDKKIDVLTLDSEADDLYEKIIELPDYSHLNILFVRGLEAALNRYEEAESSGYFLTSQSPVYRGTWAGVPKILGNLNLARDRFNEKFSFALVFLLPEFALRYFIRRAPDFFDWRSGVFDFPTYLETLHSEIDRLVYFDGDLNIYAQFTFQQRQAKLTEIKAYLSDNPDLNPNRASELWIEKGLVHAQGQEYKEAIASFDRAIEIKPDYHPAWNNRGIALANLDKYEEAIASFDRAIEIKPDKYEAWNHRGITLQTLGRNEEAIASFDRAIEIKPDYHSAWNNRGIALANLDSYEEAIISYDHALQLNSDFYEAWYNRGAVLVNLGRYEEAIISYDRVLQTNPDYHRALDNRGVALAYLGRFEEAIASYQKALAISPNYDSAYYNLACAYAQQQNLHLALDNLKQAINLNPKFREMTKTENDFDLIRDNPQFQSLLE